MFDFGNNAVSFSSPAIAANVIYFGSSDGWVHAIDGKDAKTQAEFQTDGSKANASKYIDAQGKMIMTTVYPDMTLEGTIIGLDRMFSLGSILSSPVLADGVLYVGSTDGNLYALM